MRAIQYFYTVRSNDTLSQIAKRWELPVQSIIAANNLIDPNRLEIGQQLSIPPGVDKYQVQTGDSVYRISQLYGVPTSVIIEANNLVPPYLLLVNQLLRIPPGQAYYVVQQGDTLYEIARRFNVTTGDLVNFKLIERVNNLKSTTITPGMKLVIPYAPIGIEGTIAYNSNSGGHYDIWLNNLQNGDNKRLTTNLGDALSKPVWSPDGTKIAFVGLNRILYVIYVQEGEIGGIDQLDKDGDLIVDWSPTSDQLSYTARGKIMLYQVNTHVAFSIDQQASYVQWFPNGRELLYRSLDASRISQLYTIKVNGTGKQQITHQTGGPMNDVRLSPDGTYALYTTPGASISIIHTVNLSTKKDIEIQGGPLAKNYFPEWSPDSVSIAYSATAFEEQGYFSQIRTVHRNSQSDQIWAYSNCFSTPVTWSPDGKRIAYLSGCSEQTYATEMWVVELDHPVPIQLMNDDIIQNLQWAPIASSSGSKTLFTSQTFHVQFYYPSRWEKVRDDKYQGKDGFFQVSAIAGGSNIEEVCHNEAFHGLMPYGSKPQITQADIGHEEACFIYPSADQPKEMENQAALIVRYPKPIEIAGESYNYFILWADKDHIRDMADTLKFL